MSRRHYEHGMRPRWPGWPPRWAGRGGGRPGRTGNALDPDGPGVDLATLERIVAKLEGAP